MDLRRLFPVAFVLGAFLPAGCVTPDKPDPAATTRGVAPAPPTPGGAYDNSDIAVKNRLRSFIAGDGLATTPPKPGEPARLTAAWSNKVIYAPDPTHGGDPVPGLMGKLWLFGPDEGVPLSLDGEIFVGAWDTSPKAEGGQPVLLEVWHLDVEAAGNSGRRTSSAARPTARSCRGAGTTST